MQWKYRCMIFVRVHIRNTVTLSAIKIGVSFGASLCWLCTPLARAWTSLFEQSIWNFALLKNGSTSESYSHIVYAFTAYCTNDALEYHTWLWEYSVQHSTRALVTTRWGWASNNMQDFWMYHNWSGLSKIRQIATKKLSSKDVKMWRRHQCCECDSESVRMYFGVAKKSQDPKLGCIFCAWYRLQLIIIEKLFSARDYRCIGGLGGGYCRGIHATAQHQWVAMDWFWRDHY